MVFFFSHILDLYEQCDQEQSVPDFGTKCTFPSQKIETGKDEWMNNAPMLRTKTVSCYVRFYYWHSFAGGKPQHFHGERRWKTPQVEKQAGRHPH